MGERVRARRDPLGSITITQVTGHSGSYGLWHNSSNSLRDLSRSYQENEAENFRDSHGERMR